ncbi:MAG: uracil-DNA glycosylase [Actinobacteria bacterium]|nr:uracil-DNA glycosylase [Actinomycetota bacterium]
MEKLKAEIKACKRCPDIVKIRINPVPGEGASRASIMIVGGYPAINGAEKTGSPFSGDETGKFLRDILNDTGLSLKKNTYLTYLVKCTPKKIMNAGSPEEEVREVKPSMRHIDNCIRYLTAEISILTPHIIVSLGLDVSNIILNKFFSVDKDFNNMGKIHMKVFENPSFKLVPFFSPRDVTMKNAISRDKYIEDFRALSKLLKIV